MSDQHERQSSMPDGENGDAKSGNSGSAGAKPMLDDKAKQAVATVCAVISVLSAVETIVALYAHGSTDILVWSIVVLAVAVIATITVRIIIKWGSGRSVTLPLLPSLGALVLAGALVGGIVYHARSTGHNSAKPSTSASVTSQGSATPSPIQSATPSPTPSPSSPGSTPPVRNQGTLVMLGDGATSYDLDSTASDWGAATGTWVSQNAQYFPNQENNATPTLNMPNEPQDDVLMGTGGHWTYQDCASAKYNQSFDPKVNPNYLVGPAIAPGSSICVRTFDNTPAKTDGGHYALLVVEARTSTTLTVQITVWQ